MKKLSLIALLVSGLFVGVSANAALGDVTTSNDPAKAAAVEQHAAQLKSQQAAKPMAKTTMHHAKHHAKHHKMHAKAHHAKAHAKVAKKA